MDSEFYSIKEVAVVFNVHENTIRRAIRKGHILAIRIGEGKKSPYRVSKKSIEKVHEAILVGEKMKNKKIIQNGQ